MTSSTPPRTDDAATERGPTILLAGGGSAGHVSPLLATAAQITARCPQARLLVLGTPDGLETDLVPAAGLELLTIEKVPFPRRPNGAALRFPARFTGTLRAVRRILREREVDAVIGFGGYVCPPAYLAAAASRIPYVVHEANLRPGLANRLGARGAAAVLTALEGTQLPKARRIGMPMRASVAGLDRAARREQAARLLGLDPSRPTLLVTGGSLGAQRINTSIAEAAGDITASGAQILHITGKGKAEELRRAQRPEGYAVLEYVHAMEDAYAVADLALTRSGAGTVCELAAVGLPAVLVPLPIGNGEQALNGRGLVDAGGALMIADRDLTAEVVRERILPLLTDPERLATMSAASRAEGVTDAAEQLAQIVIGAARRA